MADARLELANPQLGVQAQPFPNLREARGGARYVLGVEVDLLRGACSSDATQH
jgi:hypothetical protein